MIRNLFVALCLTLAVVGCQCGVDQSDSQDGGAGGGTGSTGGGAGGGIGGGSGGGGGGQQCNYATTIEYVAGNNQTAAKGTKLPVNPTVKLTGPCGAAPNIPVAFYAEPGNGTISSNNVQTDSNGLASTEWTLENTAGPQTLMADVSGVDGGPIFFSATAQ